jgi:2,3-bisphosphoglycerate-independent phosphoglycerate mutase
MIDREFLDYYRHFCELTIWFKKIVLHNNSKAAITTKDIVKEFIAERNRILAQIPVERRKQVRNDLNEIAKSYYHKVARWTKQQRITVDMV